MKPIPRRLGLLLLSGAMAAGLSASVSAPAFADTKATVATFASSRAGGSSQCEPVHDGSDWRWHENGHGGHWDRWEDWGNGWEWRHYWRDDQKCKESEESGESAETTAAES